jgi:CBS domain containing-hemolysin-like protein
MAMIHDVDGVVVGMATMEDILERFVGSISDEFH